MYSMLSDKISKAPVIGSSFSADKQLKDWLRKNNFSSIYDKKGAKWMLSVKTEFMAKKTEMQWEATIFLKTYVSAASLIKEGIISQKDDKRLISLLGDTNLPFEMKPKIIEASSKDELRSKYAAWLEILNSQFENLDLSENKKLSYRNG